MFLKLILGLLSNYDQVNNIMNVAIRRIVNKTVYYLYLVDLDQNLACWTQSWKKAYYFLNNEEAKLFIDIHFTDYSDQCDIFGNEDMWSL